MSENIAPNNANDHMRILEAMLFASTAPVPTRALHERMPEGSDVGGLLMQLQETYKGRGVNLIEFDGTWAFRTANDLGDALSMEKEVSRKLSRAALETLAIIAYHQPITRAEVENIRGVATHKGTLDALMEMGWIKPGRRRESPGRPLTWVTTTTFLDQFGISAITDLPGMDDLKAAGLLDRRPAIETLPEAGDLFAANDDHASSADAGTEEDTEDDREDDDTFDEDAEYVAEGEEDESDEDADEDTEDSDDDDDDDDDSDDDEEEDD